MIKDTIDAIKAQMPLAYENIYAELSLDDDGNEYTPYGKKVRCVLMFLRTGYKKRA